MTLGNFHLVWIFLYWRICGHFLWKLIVGAKHFRNWTTGPRFNTKIKPYQYRISHCGDKTILRPSYLHNEISYTGKMPCLYWIKALVLIYRKRKQYQFMAWMSNSIQTKWCEVIAHQHLDAKRSLAKPPLNMGQRWKMIFYRLVLISLDLCWST